MYAAQPLTLLPFRQADGEPPGDVQDRERAEYDKEDCFVHARITSSPGPSAVNAIKRRGGLIYVMNTRRDCDPMTTFRFFECVQRVPDGLTRSASAPAPSAGARAFSSLCAVMKMIGI